MLLATIAAYPSLFIEYEQVMNPRRQVLQAGVGQSFVVLNKTLHLLFIHQTLTELRTGGAGQLPLLLPSPLAYAAEIRRLQHDPLVYPSMEPGKILGKNCIHMASPYSVGILLELQGIHRFSERVNGLRLSAETPALEQYYLYRQ